MTLKKTIFNGFQESQLFKRLNSQWKDHFNIYPQLPFTKIFDINNLQINKNERDFLLKTNVDITICDKGNKPLISIEFDGWSYGYNKGSEYVQVKPESLRKKKLELKLRIASEHDYPLYIISYDEKKYVSEKIHLTVIDGIVGQTMAKMEFGQKINNCVQEHHDILDSMNEFERHEYIQDLVTSLEVAMELTWDPIVKMASEIDHIFFERNISTTMSYKPLTKPELPEIKDIFDVEGIRKTIRAWKEIKWHGYEVICETPKGKSTGVAWVRNFEGMASPLIISKNIAELLALYNAATLNGIII